MRKNQEVPQTKAAMILNMASVLRGAYTPAEFERIMLPMFVVKRLHDCLLPTLNRVKTAHRKGVDNERLCGISGYPFYNIGRFTFESLLEDEENVEGSFLEFLAGFSPEIRDILDKFDFTRTVHLLAETGTLLPLIRVFAGPMGYLGPDSVNDEECAELFEELVRRYTENLGEEAGTNFTSPDLTRLLTDVLLAGTVQNNDVSAYDMVMGTGQLLARAQERILSLNPEARVSVKGQELNPFAYAIAKSDWLIRGGESTL